MNVQLSTFNFQRRIEEMLNKEMMNSEDRREETIATKKLKRHKNKRRIIDTDPRLRRDMFALINTD
jgi:hypothetical protein